MFLVSYVGYYTLNTLNFIDMLVSECCGAEQYLETDLCSECLEHTDFYDDEEEEIAVEV